MSNRPSPAEISSVLSRALLLDEILAPEDTAVLFFDLDGLTARVRELEAAFPPTALHAIAVKANPLVAILEHLRGLSTGLEVASAGELHLALRAGFAPNTMVYDSPAKTTAELRHAMELGVHVNADSLEELAVIDEVLRNSPPTSSTFGLRINPQVGAGSIESTSVAGVYSKFGVPMNEARAAIVEAYRKYEWLSGIHVHVGSQGCALDLLLAGVDGVWELTREIQASLTDSGRRIRVFDIGGGLPVTYRDGDASPSVAEYGAALRSRFPELFTPEYRLVTEFGRSIHANSGWAASRVEYVKTDALRKTAIIHIGADLLLRRCYRPDDWHHDFVVLDSHGHLKTGQDDVPYNIAGPLCFSGDILTRDLPLPPVEPGDYVVVRDTGAYTMSMWSHYNSRQSPKAVGYQGGGDSFAVLRARESLERVVEFWT